MPISIQAPLTKEQAAALRAGDMCLMSGVIFTARDAAHKLLCEQIREGRELPFELQDAVIYYVGPTPAKPGQVIGSAGPTTACRMDAYSPVLIAQGQNGMIGKGCRGPEVTEAIINHGAVYFGAIGGCGALLSKCVRKCQVIAFEELGPEAVCRLEVEDLPVTVVIDSRGTDLYRTGREAFLTAQMRSCFE